MKKRIRKDFIVLIILLITICYTIFTTDIGDLSWLLLPRQSPESVEIRCYDIDKPDQVLPYLNSATVQKNTSIFFVETSCHSNNLTLSPRQACAIESAALQNPKSQVYLIVPSPIKDNALQTHVEKLKSYPNIHIRHVNMNSFFVGTPLESWYRRGTLRSSRWPRSHASDILRYTILWKYGGVYVDLDVVLLKPFNNLTNFAGAEDHLDVAVGLLSLSHNHPLTHLTMEDLRKNFKGYEWGNNGPGVITRSLKKFCVTDDVAKMNNNTCHGFTVFPPSAFYPIVWRQWKDYFATDETKVREVMKKLDQSYAIHVWNLHSKSLKINVTYEPNQPYSILASKYCPKVFYSLTDTF